MDMLEFKKIVDIKKQLNPFWFDNPSDLEAQDYQVAKAESQLGVLLPKKYKEYVNTFGGGYFAFANIFSVTGDSECYICKRNEEARNYLPKNYVAISDDEAGGMYGYVVREGVCGDEIFYWNHDDGSISKTAYDDLFEYLVEVGLSVSLEDK